MSELKRVQSTHRSFSISNGCLGIVWIAFNVGGINVGLNVVVVGTRTSITLNSGKVQQERVNICAKLAIENDFCADLPLEFHGMEGHLSHPTPVVPNCSARSNQKAISFPVRTCAGTLGF